MKTSITSTLRLFAGMALLLGASAVQAATYTAGVVYEGNFNEDYLNGSPLLAKFEADSGVSQAGIMGDSYSQAFTVTATTFNDDSEGIAGTWSFDPTKISIEDQPVLYPTKVLVKADGGWFFYEVTLGTTEGEWSTAPIATLMPNEMPPGLSHISFYDTAVPIPAAAYLFGSALIGLAGIGYRRRS
jgi:hypothetical protein